jgi:ParB-like chromosome segregation protein Spo0J
VTTETTTKITEEIVQISIDLIDDPPYQDQHNNFYPINPKDVQTLADDIRKGGVMLNPVDVRPHPTVPGRFVRIAGRHRIAAGRQLGWTVIEAKVIRGIDDKAAEWLTLTENLVRSDFSGPPQAGDTRKTVRIRSLLHRDQMLARLAQLYREQHPEAAQAEEVHRAASRGQEVSQETGERGQFKPPKIPTAIQHIAQETGQHPDNVGMAIKRGETFSKKDGAILAEKGVDQKEQNKLSRLDKEVRSLAIQQIEAGAEPDEAIEIATRTVNHNHAPQSAAPAEPPPPPELDQLPDQDWLAAMSQPNEDGTLPTRERCVRSYFDFYALLWRRTMEVRGQFSKAIDRISGNLRGPYGEVQAGSRSLLALYNRALGVAHPKEWRVCGTCGGSFVKEGKSCKDCEGGFTFGQAPRIKAAAKPKTEKPAKPEKPAKEKEAKKPKGRPKGKPKASSATTNGHLKPDPVRAEDNETIDPRTSDEMEDVVVEQTDADETEGILAEGT